MVRQKKTKPASLPVLRPNAAGIDIGATEIVVAVPPGRDQENEDVRTFPTFTQDLYRLAAWLKQCDVDTVAMESTGVYWIPLFQILEAQGFEVFLVNARSVKNVPGRKTDVRDCQWLQFLHSVGLLEASYRPAKDVCALRTILRHQDALTKLSAQHIQHMQKSLDQMNLKLHNVISDITGLSGLKILDAILDGERDPKTLARLCHPRIQAPKEIVAKSLVGDYLPEHLFTLRQSLECYRHYQRQLEDLDREVHRMLDAFPEKDSQSFSDPITKPQKNKVGLGGDLKRIFGVDITQIPGIGLNTAQTILGEVGPDFTKFRSASAFASWLTLCPNNKVSGGKVLSRQTRKTKSRAATALRMAANSMHHNKSWLGHFYRRMRSKLGAPKAIVATAHRLARIIYHLITTGQEYDESVYAAAQLRDQNRQLRRVSASAKALGYQLMPIASASA
jgi:transposase